MLISEDVIIDVASINHQTFLVKIETNLNENANNEAMAWAELLFEYLVSCPSEELKT